MTFIIHFIMACIMVVSIPCMAQTSTTNQPIEITADDAIEWLRDDNMYRARGNAKAVQGETTVTANTLTATYNPDDTNTIETVMADGNVRITNANQTVTGDKGVYTVATRHIHLTGDNLSVTAPDLTVTASDSLDYSDADKRATAVGNARAITTQNDQKTTVTANTIIAYLMETAEGNTDIKRLETSGKTRIETASEIILGDKATYNVVSETATVEGNVRITRGPNQLNGSRAVVNMNTGISQLFADPNAPGGANDGRVRALFYPGSNDTLTEQQ